MGLSYHPCRPGRPGPRRPLWWRASRSLHGNVPDDSAPATQTDAPGGQNDPSAPDASGDHPGIAGGTGIGYGAAAVHSYRLQAKQRVGNTMKEKTKKHKGIGQE